MSYSTEFPLLESIGLYASSISGDGDCLFHALSDQLYGHENNHVEIRAKAVEHMRANASHFRHFMDVGPLRRAPKRRVAASSSKSTMAATPSDDAIDQAFAKHLARMSKAGVYGDNMEISAFAREYGCDVKIYQRDFAYVVTGGDGSSVPRRMVHIAYHTWEHYSSVRNTDGPHTGLPNVTPVALTEEGKRLQEERIANSSYVLPWMEGVVAQSLPHVADAKRIREVLEECKGNIDAAVSRLLDEVDIPVDSGSDGARDAPPEEKAKSEKTSFKIQDRVTTPDDSTTETDAGSDKKEAAAKGKTTPTSAEERVEEASEDSVASGVGSGPDSSANTAKESRKPLRRPKRESAREKKAKQKAAAKARKKGKPPPNGGSDGESNEKGTTSITTGIKELYV